jgi:exonuclease SbcC
LEEKWAWSSTLNGGELAVKLEEQKIALKEYGASAVIIKTVEECWPLIVELEHLYDEGIRLAKEKDGWHGGSDIGQVCEQYRSEWKLAGDRLVGLNRQLELQEGVLAELKLSHADLVGELNEHILGKGWESIAQVLEQRLGEQEYKRLKDLEAQNQLSLHSAEQALTSYMQQKEELGQKCSSDAEEEVERLWEEIKALIDKKREELNEVKRRIDNHEENKREVNQLDNQIEKEGASGKKWVLLDKLIGDRMGKRFNDYAQELTLQRLLVLANHRLGGLTDRYQIDIPTDQEEADGLMIVDDHMGGQRRSVKTLSGGETFLMSLSLALALSDLAAKNVEINSLFIDEGFGTLDPETLDQTIDTLERLQMESEKTIGIISHVEALKERIGTQIQLERNGQGYSSIKVVG